MLDGGAHFYNTYETSDGEHICLGSIEPQFYALLVEKAGLDAERFSAQMNASQWPEFEQELIEVFKSKTQAQWCEIMEGSDVCFAPVLSIFEAPDHPHNKARNSFLEIDGVVQPAPSPRFSRTTAEISHSARAPGADTEAVLADSGFSAEEVAGLKASGVIG